MTGFRVGWVRCSEELAKLLTKVQEPLVSCAPTFNQTAAAAAITGPQDCVRSMRGHYQRRRDLALGVLAARGRRSAYVPGGAFYLPIDISGTGEPPKAITYPLRMFSVTFLVLV
jgi:aspartate aminotransferase